MHKCNSKGKENVKFFVNSHSKDKKPNYSIKKRIESEKKAQFQVTPVKTVKLKFDTAYSRDYISYLRSKEVDSIIAEDFVGTQNKEVVNGMTRLTIMNWLFDIVIAWDLSINTLFMAALLLDKLIDQKKMASTYEFTDYATSCLRIASKFEDLPAKFITQEMFSDVSREEVSIERAVEIEKEILDLNIFNVNLVTYFTYVEKIVCIFKSDKNKQIIKLLAAMSIFKSSLRKYRPSLVVHSLLEFAQTEARSHQKELVDDNDDFLHGQEYLDLKLLNHHELDECHRLQLMNHIIFIKLLQTSIIQIIITPMKITLTSFEVLIKIQVKSISKFVKPS